MKKFLLSIFCLFCIFSYATAEETATLSFADKAQRTTFTTAQQVWEQNGVTITNNKASSTNDVADYANPARFYKGSELVVETENGMSQIVFNCNNATYANALGTSIGEGASVSGKDVTVELSGETSYTIATLSAQVRMNSLVVTFKAEEETAVEAPTFSIEKGTYYNPFTVEIAAAEGAAVYYTLDGTEPTAESTVYSEAIAINEFGSTTTIKAVAIIDGESSNVASATYSLKVSTPEFSIKGGVYNKLTGMDALKFTTETEGATILYNNRGGDPKTEGSKTWGSLSVLSTTTVKAVSFVKNAEGDSIFSDIAEEKYYISEVKPFEKATEFAAGEYIIYASDVVATPHAETSNYGYLPIDSTEITKEKFIETFKFYAFTFTEVEGGYTIQDTFGRYLYMAGSYNNFNVAQEMPAEGAVWTVAIDETTGEATITNVAKNKYIQLSTQYKSFGSYATAQSNAVLPILFALSEYPTITITPKNGDTVPCFDKVTVTCEQGISYNETDENYAYYTIGWDYTKLEFDNVTAVDENTIEFSFNAPIESNGDYRVTFPTGLFTLAPNGLAIASEETQISLTVDNPNILEVTYANPENGATVNKLEYLYFEFNQDIVKDIENAVITDEEGTEYTLTISGTDAWNEKVPATALCLKTNKPITTPGNYTFVLKKEYVYAGTDVRIANDITYNFTVVEGLKVTNVLPAEETECESISEIVLTFNKAVFHDYISALWVYDEAGNEYEFTKQVGEEDYQVESLTFVTETPITVAGTYTFTLEDYAVYCYNANMQMETAGTQSFSFTFDGSKITTDIEKLKVENGKMKVIYDLTGRRVDAITTPGIYIVDGKKLLVK